jgi:hypothetical protein
VTAVVVAVAHAVAPLLLGAAHGGRHDVALLYRFSSDVCATGRGKVQKRSDSRSDQMKQPVSLQIAPIVIFPTPPPFPIRLPFHPFPKPWERIVLTRAWDHIRPSTE